MNIIITTGRVYFQKQLTKIVLEEDGSMIIEDEVLDLLSAEGFSFMLLQDSEEWSRSNVTSRIEGNIQLLQVSFDLFNKGPFIMHVAVGGGS